MIPEPLALLLAGAAVMVLPGWAVCAAARLRLPLDERPTVWVAVSLALLTVAFAVSLAAGLSIGGGLVAVAAVTGVVAAAATRRRTIEHGEPTAPAPPRWWLATVGGLAIVTAAAAVRFAPVGSIDRWWYLAYVRRFVDAPLLSTAEPFLGTGETFARFGVHPWLFGLAAWARLAGLDPVTVYERGAPVLVAVAAVSALCVLSRTLFGDGPLARLAVVASVLSWAGGLVPLAARAGEDKVLAAAFLAPLLFALLLRALREAPGETAPRDRTLVHARTFALLGAVAVATAAVHALVYAFALGIGLVVAALVGFAAREATGKRRAVVAATLLLVVAAAPAVSGLLVRTHLQAIGAELDSPDHPVVRVHDGRGRRLHIDGIGPVTHPRLLAQPLMPLAAVGLILLAWPAARRRRSEIADDAQVYLLAASLLPLAVAFLPPLVALAGQLVPPWMVYRVLWLLPVGALAAVAVDALRTRLRLHESLAVLALLIVALPALHAAFSERSAAARGRLALPSGTERQGELRDELREAVAAIASLPINARIVAAPELAERLPALTGRAVLAGLDRSTVVFAGSRDLGEARLRARAALLAGDIDVEELVASSGAEPTHALFDPRDAAPASCDGLVHRSPRYALCTLDAARPVPEAPPVKRLVAVRDAGLARPLIAAECRRRDDASPAMRRGRDIWSARMPWLECHADLPLPDSAAAASTTRELLLLFGASTGRATDEWRLDIVATKGRDVVHRFHAVERLSGEKTFALSLGAVDADRVTVRLLPSFLADIRLRRLIVATR